MGPHPLRPALRGSGIEERNSTQRGTNTGPGISGERKPQMKRHTVHLVSLLSLALAMACLIPQRAAADDDDPPGRVARLGFVRGNVSFEPAGTEDWVSAVINRPLTTGDKLWNDNDSFSELHLGSASIRLGSNTGFSFLNLTDNMTQVQLTEGTLNIRVRRLGDDETFEVDTPNLAFTLLRPGNYKVNVDEAGDATVVIVRDGQGEVTGGGSAYTIHPREVGTFNGTDQIDADVESWDNSTDDFDNWCAERDARIDNSVSARYVSNDVIGYEDLDEYGGWRATPDYGTIWFPHVAVVGWAPYHYGHWAYIAPWGYTWVDDAPWGFAPFHYGRWVTVGGVWGWVPARPAVVVVGVPYVRPVYAPALVAWVGGPHFAVGLRPVVSRQPRLCEQRQHYKHHGQHHRGEQLLQHHGDQQNHRDQRDLRQSASHWSRIRNDASGIHVRSIGLEKLRHRQCA
jgi:hypothetical protein